MSTLALDIRQSSTVDASAAQNKAIGEQLTEAILEWWSEEGAEWDALVERNTVAPNEISDVDSDLWDSMPTIDSKTVARASPIFETHLGRPLAIRLIRPGGYDSIDHMIRHLVPAMMEESQARGGIRAVK